MQRLVSLGCGLLFGAGLLISGMANPDKVVAFLDLSRIASGSWDPSLLFVLGGALLVYLPAYLLLVKKRMQAAKAPVFESHYHLPEKQQIDRQLVLGAAVFGVGWGMVGICPGPAITILSFGGVALYGFVLSLLGGIVMIDWFERRGRGLAVDAVNPSK